VQENAMEGLPVSIASVAFVVWGVLPASAPAKGFSARIAAASEALAPKLAEMRRDLHEHPELSNQEERTSRIVAERLTALGLEVKTGVAGHGVVALLRGARPGPVVAVRADMDALPIQEAGDVPYKSQVPGVMHACGHDVHTTIGLGTATVLAGLRDRLPGTVKFIFQPSEEAWPDGTPAGAAKMIQEGVLENPRPLAIFGLHVGSSEAGNVAYVPSGDVMAALDDFTITIHGKMAHGGMEPHKGVDAIVVASECATALQTIRSRRIEPMRAMVLTLGTIHGGTRRNIIADTVKIEGTLRTLDPAVRETAIRAMREILSGVTAAHGATFDLDFSTSLPSVHNDRALAEASIPSLRRAVGENHLLVDEPELGSEDFAFYQQVVPGFFFTLGVRNKAKGITAGVHTPEFDVDEACLQVGVRTMSTLLVDFLERRR
jgi:amidohydrolase